MSTEKALQSLYYYFFGGENMKLSIGENIRNYRKKNDLTQEEFADRLGVSYQSVSRWENGNFYPDLELIPSIAKTLGVTVDSLFGIPEIEKEKCAEQVFDELRRECLKHKYDANRIVELIRDIRRNYMDSDSAWRPWSEGNGRAFRDPVVLPEVRLMAEAYLERHPMNPHTIRTMAEIEDEEHIQDFIKKYTTPFDCSARVLLFNRYQQRGDAEKYDKERCWQLYSAFEALLCPRYFLKFNVQQEIRIASDEFMENLLSLIRCDAVDDRPDIWVAARLELEIKSAKRLISNGKTEEAISKLSSAVKLLEDVMKITDKTVLPTSCRFLDGMEWKAWECWFNSDNNPDSPEERMIYIQTAFDDMCTCDCIFPSKYYGFLQDSEFEPVRNHLEFEKLCQRIKALIVTR